MTPLRSRDMVVVVMLAVFIAVGVVLVATYTPRLPAAIADARAFDHPHPCSSDAPAGSACLRVGPGTIVNLYKSTGGKGGPTYYATVRLPDGTIHSALTVGGHFYAYAQLGDAVTVDMWGSHLTLIADRAYSTVTNDTPVSYAGGAAAGAGIGVVVIVFSAGGIGLISGRGRRRDVVANLDEGPLVYTPSPTTWSWLARMGIWLVAMVAVMLWGVIIDDVAPIGVAATIFIVGLLATRDQCNQSLTLSRDGLVYVRRKRAPVEAAWPMVVGIRSFGAGRGRYSAIALANGTRIRHQTLLGFTALNESLKYTIAQYAGRAAAAEAQSGGWAATPPVAYPGYVPYAAGTPGVTPSGADPTPPEFTPPAAYPPGWPPPD